MPYETGSIPVCYTSETGSIPVCYISETTPSRLFLPPKMVDWGSTRPLFQTYHIATTSTTIRSTGGPNSNG
jgi:hypothetical protein